MDGYHDLYRTPIPRGGYTSLRYQLGYGAEDRSYYSLYADPRLSAYARVPLDAYASYSAYQPDFLRFRRYAAPLRSLPPRRHSTPRRRPSAQTNRRPPPAQNLAPKKTLFKKARKSLSVQVLTPKKGPRRAALQKESNLTGKLVKSIATSLVKEMQELHSLYRTGIDQSTGKKSVKPSAKKSDGTSLKQSNPNVTSQKRKADTPKKDDDLSSAKKPKGNKKKKKKKKLFANEEQQEVKKEEKPVVLTPKAAKAEPPTLTEEEKKEVEESLVLQNAACKAVGEFLGIPKKREEPVESVAPNCNTGEAKVDASLPNTDEEAQANAEEASKPTPLSADKEKELEEKGYVFFSKFLEENQQLHKLYLEKKDAGTFECLVCLSVDPETSKKFTNLTNLVMHTSMRKQKRPEHRGYGRAICDVLGWESLRAPKQSAKQVKEDGEPVKQSEVENVSEEGNSGET